MARLAHGGGGCVCAHGPSSNHLSVNLCSFSHFSLWERSVERWREECRVCWLRSPLLSPQALRWRQVNVRAGAAKLVQARW